MDATESCCCEFGELIVRGGGREREGGRRQREWKKAERVEEKTKKRRENKS